jgi:dTDP-4-amino-4,6-dideoxygalactose transaminase
VADFEREWARYCGTRHAVGVANGTDALELVLRALDIGSGDEVIVPANTFVATAEAVVLCGATPRFVDVDPDTLLVTPEIVSAAVNHRTAAVIAVELYGNMPRMEALASLCDRAGLALIEDAAQAHGATRGGREAGSFGIAGCFSFYPTKSLGAFGDAGAVVTDDGELADAVRTLSNHGRPADAPHFHGVVARNSRLDALQAAVLHAKLPLLDGWNAARRDRVDLYRSEIPAGIRLVEVEPDVTCAYHQHVVLIDGRDAVRAALAERGIQTGVHYPIPCHHQVPYRRFATDPLPAVERSCNRILSLPLYPHMSDRQVVDVCAALADALDQVHG